MQTTDEMPGIMDANSVHGKRFEVQVEYKEGSIEQTGFDKLSDAALRYEEILASGEYVEIAIHDLETCETVIGQQG